MQKSSLIYETKETISLRKKEKQTTEIATAFLPALKNLPGACRGNPESTKATTSNALRGSSFAIVKKNI
jgi:hypothetical protein